MKLIKAAALVSSLSSAKSNLGSPNFNASLQNELHNDLALSNPEKNRRLDSSEVTTFFKSLGGLGNERAYSIALTNNNSGYALTGYVDSYGYGGGNDDLWILKLDNSANVVWSMALGSSYSDYGRSILETQEEDIIVLGDSYQSSSCDNYYDDLVAVKLSKDGEVKWLKQWEWIVGPLRGRSSVETNDGNIVFVASYDDSWDSSCIIQLNSTTGTPNWAKSLDSTRALEVITTNNNGLLLAGQKYSSDAEDMLLVKFTASGEISWAKAMGWSEVLYEQYSSLETGAFNSVCETNGGHYFATGYMYGDHDLSTNAYRSVPIIKLDQLGNLLSVRAFIVDGSDETYAQVIRSTQDDGLIVLGYYEDGSHTDNSGFIVKLDTSFNICWAKGFGSSHNDYAYDIQEESSTGSFVIVAASLGGYGQGSTETLIIKVDRDGEIEDCNDSVWDVDFDMSEDLSYYFSSVSASDLELENIVLSEKTSTMSSELPSSASEETLETVCELSGSSANTDQFDSPAFCGETTSSSISSSSTSTSTTESTSSSTSSSTSTSTAPSTSSSTSSSTSTSTRPSTSSSTSSSTSTSTVPSTSSSTSSSTSTSTAPSTSSSTSSSTSTASSVPLSSVTFFKTLGGLGNERAYSVALTSDGGSALTGDVETYGSGGADIITAKLDTSGNLAWSSAFGSSLSEHGRSLVATNDGGVIVLGYCMQLRIPHCVAKFSYLAQLD